jgi:predicted enzyme related to lactoylglutathione lyase
MVWQDTYRRMLDVDKTDDKGNKASGGGMHKRMHPEQQIIKIINYIDAKSVDGYSSKVGGFEGKGVAPKMAVTGSSFAFCLDTENKRFAM